MSLPREVTAMSRGALIVLLLTTFVSADEPSGKPRADTHGDPLPHGASARFGSVRFRHGDTITAVAYSPDGKTLITVGNDRTIRVWDLETGKEKQRMAHEDVTSEGRGPSSLRAGVQASFSANGKRVATSSGPYGGVRVWDLESGKALPSIATGR